MNESRTHLFGSSSLGREYRKRVFAYVHVWGDFFLCFSVSTTACGWASTWDLDKSPCVGWVTQGVLPRTICDVPRLQSRLQFSKSKAQGNWENYFPGASSILLVQGLFMQIGNIPTTKLHATHLPRRCSCGCLMAQCLSNLSALHCSNEGQLVENTSWFFYVNNSIQEDEFTHFSFHFYQHPGMSLGKCLTPQASSIKWGFGQGGSQSPSKSKVHCLYEI